MTVFQVHLQIRQAKDYHLQWSILFGGLGNLLIGYILFRAGKISKENKWSLLVFFAGIVCISIMSSIAFIDKMH